MAPLLRPLDACGIPGVPIPTGSGIDVDDHHRSGRGTLDVGQDLRVNVRVGVDGDPEPQTGRFVPARAACQVTGIHQGT